MEKFDIAGQQLSPICATCLGDVEFSLADPQVLAHQQGCQLGGFPKIWRFSLRVSLL
jgi:hypothetical protein